MSPLTASRELHRPSQDRSQRIGANLYQRYLPQRGRGKSVEQTLQAYPDRFARVDATEQSVRRWKEEKTQSEHYSGKPVLADRPGKKDHTRKKPTRCQRTR